MTRGRAGSGSAMAPSCPAWRRESPVASRRRPRRPGSRSTTRSRPSRAQSQGSCLTTGKPGGHRGEGTTTFWRASLAHCASEDALYSAESGASAGWVGRSAGGGCSGRWQRSGDGSAGDHPLRGLACGGCDVVVVGVVVQNGDVFSFCYCGDEQVGEADCPDAAAAPEGGLGGGGTPPVFVQGGEPFVAGVTVGAQFIKLRAGPGCPPEFEFDHPAGGHQPCFDQRAENRGHPRVAQARQRAGVGKVAGYCRHAARITSSSSRSGRPPEASLRRSRRRAASAATSRRAALTVSFFVSVCSAS